MLLSEIYSLVSVGRPLWREVGSAICSVITPWYESLRTRNHTLLSHLRLPQRSQSYFTSDGQSVNQYVLVSSTLVGLATRCYFLSKFEVTLRLTVCQSVCLDIEHPRGTCDQILLPVGMLLSEICSLVSVGRPLWREDESAICNVITQWSESLRTHNHILLSLLRPPTWRARFPYLYPPGTGWPSYTPGNWVPFTSSLTTRRSDVSPLIPTVRTAW
jgi:hypothetical protein